VDVSRRSFALAGAGILFGLDPGLEARDVTFWAADGFSGRTTTHAGDETRPVLTLSAAFALGSLLHDRGPRALDEVVRWGVDDVVGSSPVCAWPDSQGLPVAALARAALRNSDATATNLLLARAGGPSAVTAFCRQQGDDRTRLDRPAPASCAAAPWDPLDTTTSQALARSYGTLLSGGGLSPASARRLTALLGEETLGPWTLHHAYGTGRYGTSGVVGVAVRGRRRVLLAVGVRCGQPGSYGARTPALRCVATLLRELDGSW